MYRTKNPQKAFEVRLRLFFENLLWILLFYRVMDSDIQTRWIGYIRRDRRNRSCFRYKYPRDWNLYCSLLTDRKIVLHQPSTLVDCHSIITSIHDTKIGCIIWLESFGWNTFYEALEVSE